MILLYTTCIYEVYDFLLNQQTYITYIQLFRYFPENWETHPSLEVIHHWKYIALHMFLFEILFPFTTTNLLWSSISILSEFYLLSWVEVFPFRWQKKCKSFLNDKYYLMS